MACSSNASKTVNSPLGKNIAYFRNNCGITFSDDLNYNCIVLYYEALYSVAYLGFHFGGWVQNIFGKVGVVATRLLGRFGGMLPRENFKKWCNLENILLKFCKKNCKKIHFYRKIIDNILLRTLYLGVLEHTPQISCQLCNLVCFVAHFP